MLLAENRKPLFFYGWLIVAAAFFIQMVAWGTSITFGIFFKPLLAEFAWTRAMTSGAFSLHTLIRGLLGTAVGGLSDKYGPKIVVALSGLFLGLGYIFLSRITALWQLYLFYGVMVGMGMSASFIPLATTIAAWFVKKRGTATAICLSGSSFGCMVMAPTSSWLISTYGFRASYLIMGIFAVILIVVASHFLKRDPSSIGAAPYGIDEVKKGKLNGETGGLSLPQAIRTRHFWIFCGAIFCGYFCHFIVLVHLVPLAIDHGNSASKAANLISIMTGIGILGRIVLGVAADRMGNRQVFIICFILLLVNWVWLSLVTAFWMLCLFAIVFGLVGSVCVVLSSPMIAELFGLSSHGAILGVVMFLSTIAGAAGPFSAGLIFDIFGSYHMAILICAILSTTGIGLTAFTGYIKPPASATRG